MLLHPQMVKSPQPVLGGVSDTPSEGFGAAGLCFLLNRADDPWLISPQSAAAEASHLRSPEEKPCPQ